MEKYLYNMGIIGSLCFNSTVLIDLYLTLKNPFYPRGKRAKWYYLFCISVILSFSITYLIYDPMDPTFTSWGTKPYDTAYGTVCAVLGLTSLLATILVLKRLAMKGTSRKLKMTVLKRHILYAFFYLLSLVQVLIHFFHHEAVEIVGQKGYDLLESVLDSLGIYLALSRLLEPYVWQEFKIQFKHWVCCLTFESKEKV